MMNKCSPSEMRKNLECVDKFREAGMDFVAIPARDSAHKIRLVEYCQGVFAEILEDAEREEKQR